MTLHFAMDQLSSSCMDAKYIISAAPWIGYSVFYWISDSVLSK